MGGGIHRGEPRGRRRHDAAGRLRGGVRGDWQRRARIGGAGVVADRIGKARVATWAMLVSGACCAAAGFVFHAPPVLLFALAIVWGIAVVADSAQLSALVAQYSPREHVGTALTMQTCAGFLLTMASIRLLPIAAQTLGWRWVFLCLAPGPCLVGMGAAGTEMTVRLKPDTTCAKNWPRYAPFVSLVPFVRFVVAISNRATALPLTRAPGSRTRPRTSRRSR